MVPVTAVGPPIVTVAVATHPLASVTVHVYEASLILLADAVVAPVNPVEGVHE